MHKENWRINEERFAKLQQKSEFRKALCIKGIVHNFRSDLIFWIVMGCGIGDFAQRGLKMPKTQDFWVFILSPGDLDSRRHMGPRLAAQGTLTKIKKLWTIPLMRKTELESERLRLYDRDWDCTRETEHGVVKCDRHLYGIGIGSTILSSMHLSRLCLVTISLDLNWDTFCDSFRLHLF